MSRTVYTSLTLCSRTMQFVINELPMLLLCLCAFVWGGLPERPFGRLALFVGGILFLCLTYRYVYMRRMRYHIGGEQIVCEHGVFQHSVDYMELYRVVDFAEHQTFIQQLFGLKTVTIFSMDRSSPRLEIIGVSSKQDVVSLIRERVETNKKKKGIYEITNR